MADLPDRDILARVAPDLRQLIVDVKPYTTRQGIRLDTRENPYDLPWTRGSVDQSPLLQRLSSLRQVDSGQIGLANGVTHALTVLIRLFCSEGLRVCALAEGGSHLAAAALLAGVSVDYDLAYDPAYHGLVYLATPDLETGAMMSISSEALLQVEVPIVVDESLIDYAPTASILPRLTQCRQVFVLQSFGYALGAAGLHLAAVYSSSRALVAARHLLERIPVDMLTVRAAAMRLDEWEEVSGLVKEVVINRGILSQELDRFSFVREVYPSAANFVAVRVAQACDLQHYLHQLGIYVELCKESLVQITIGTPSQNHVLLQALQRYDTLR